MPPKISTIFQAGIESVRDRGSRRFIQQPQNFYSGNRGRIFGGLSLGIIEISRHSDDHSIEVTGEG